MILGNDPILLTPGPLTTSLATKQAMLRDWGSWDASFNAITGTICRDLVDIVHGGGTHVCVPLQGSGTFSVEAAIGNLVPRDGKVLVPQNGAYCQRILKILKILGRAHVALDLAEDRHPTGAMVEAALAADPAITHVAQVHCETGTGILNPLPEIAAGLRAPRPRAHRRRDEFLRRDRHRRVEVPGRCRHRRFRQVHRGRSRAWAS